MQYDIDGMFEDVIPRAQHMNPPREEKEDKSDFEDEGATYSNTKPEAVPDGSPRHIFFLKKDESVLAMKLMLWGGNKGIVSFEGTLSNEMKSNTGNEDTDHDITFLQTYQPPEGMDQGASTVPVFRFLCVPDKPYLTRMPTGNDVIRDLGHEENFLGRQRGLKGSEIPHVEGGDDYSDELHTDRENQYIFAHEEEETEFDDLEIDLEGMPADEIEAYVEGKRKEYAELKEANNHSVQALQELEAFVKNGHLYYGVFHSKTHYKCGPRCSDSIYVFAVGVSPQSGNLVGVFAMQTAKGITC